MVFFWKLVACLLAFLLFFLNHDKSPPCDEKQPTVATECQLPGHDIHFPLGQTYLDKQEFSTSLSSPSHSYREYAHPTSYTVV